MATVAPDKFYTPEDLLEIHDRPMPELVDGQLMEREMGLKSDRIALTLMRRIGNFVEEHDLGETNGSQGSFRIFPGEPNRVRIPDGSYTSKAHIPSGGTFEGHGLIAPDLVVEVVSPNDVAEELHAKLNDYQSAGVLLIWVVYPKSRTIQVHALNQPMRQLRERDVLTGGDVLPGFECSVAGVFA